MTEEQYSNVMVADPESTRSESWKETARNEFKTLEESFDNLKYSADEVKTIYHTIAACLHLGMAGVNKGKIFYVYDGLKYNFCL